MTRKCVEGWRSPFWGKMYKELLRLFPFYTDDVAFGGVELYTH
jgi:hypothetical protein